MSKYLTTKPGSLESAVLEAVSPAQQAAIAIAKKEKGEKPKNEEKVECPKCKGEGCDHCDGKGYHMMDEGSKEEYEKFFNAALKKFGVDSPADFKSDEEKKKFFNYVDKNYKGEKSEEVKEEKDMSGMCCKNCGDMFGKPTAESSCQYDAYDPMGENWIPKEQYSEKKSVKEEVSLAELAAKHISDMWAEASKSPKKEEEEPKKKDNKTTMTGKPMSNIEVSPKNNEED